MEFNSKEAQTLKQELMQFTGTEYWHKVGLFGGLIATDGVLYLAEQAGAFWLLDIVDSILHKLNDFAVVELEATESNTGKVTIHNGTGGKRQKVFHAQALPYTDFPFPKIMLYVQQNVIMLTSEY